MWEPGDQMRVTQEQETSCDKVWTRIAAVRRKEEDRVGKSYREGAIDFDGFIGCMW